ncbi:NAD(P)/FAD-dependent oxidoreductase [Pseudonocardia halophobica]|uniref:Cyclohexanone monooxygenase n=1 Tax=Pseudonocardia halophobica TaxID=29401 RepID=A0A9W6NZ58_9PSEU|nr:NAD(P)/FAD-dependent oxidoreductase [Pseudonocardia halophobica]GLL14426.1 cyclohexanone monooxygenase [Pseudonocardia halophobica]
MDNSNDVDVLIVGAGFAGLYQLTKARKLGLSARVIERGSGVGGTWYWNRYPGARCDTPSIFYSASYLPDLDQEWKWPEIYPRQPKILEYLEHIAERENLYPQITFNTSVVAAEWDDDSGRWTVRTDSGERIVARYVVMATGTLTAAKTPEVPGLDTFEGRWFHTGRWPHEEVDFRGRRVAIIGTGSTAVQAIPVVADAAESLTVVQRTPKFVVPAANRPLTAEEWLTTRVNYPLLRAKARYADFGTPLDSPEVELDKISEEERTAILEEHWQAGTFILFVTSYRSNSGIMNPAVNDILAEFARAKIREIVKDSRTAETLTPHGYPIGVNRLCIGTNFYETFNRDNVSLVDAREEPIVGITPEGFQTSRGHYAVDDLIFATGYDAMTGALTSIDITGRSGLLRETWSEGPSTYLGVLVSGYPNLFLVTGPGGPSVLSNAVVTGEQSVDFISTLIRHAELSGHQVVEADSTAEKSWMEHVAEVAQRSLYREAWKANAWYTGRNVPGKKVVFMPYAGGVGTYEQIWREVVADDFRGFSFASAAPGLQG